VKIVFCFAIVALLILTAAAPASATKGSSPTPNQVAELLAFFLRLPFGMRKVLKSDQRPFEIKPQQESVWICMCGLSKNQPFCDGSHKTTRDEEDGKTYEYDAEGHRHEI
jgi:CDGSH-type Zn-finger protein